MEKWQSDLRHRLRRRSRPPRPPPPPGPPQVYPMRFRLATILSLGRELASLHTREAETLDLVARAPRKTSDASGKVYHDAPTSRSNSHRIGLRIKRSENVDQVRDSSVFETSSKWPEPVMVELS